MKLLTRELKEKFKRVSELKISTGGKQEYDKNPKVIAKFFHPFLNANWYATEYDPEFKRFFGFVCGLTGRSEDDEWGYFSLDELESIRVNGLPMERDILFGNPNISEVDKIVKISGFHKS